MSASTITREQYFGPKVANPACTATIIDNADFMLTKVNALLVHCAEQGVYQFPVDPDTSSCISGSKGGTGDGGYRLPDSRTGALNSKHKMGRAVDVYDPGNVLDNYISQFDEDGGARNTLLQEFGLYREAPHATQGWCHLQDLAPGSGRRTFNP